MLNSSSSIINISTSESSWLPGMPKLSLNIPLLFCFSYAGGSSEIYRQWQTSMKNICQICPVELPGRGSRFGESFCDSLLSAAEGAANAIAPYTQSPYILFGHSLGSVMALETARKLQSNASPSPLCLIVSGRFPPHAQPPRKQLHTMPDTALIDEMRRLGGTPEEILQNKEILEMMLPIVREDFRLIETHKSDPLPCLNIPIYVCCGRDDEDSPIALLTQWKEITDKTCSINLFDGGHFYINESRDALIRHICSIIKKLYNPN